MTLTPKERWALLALLALNVVVKCCWLGVNELAHDEPFTVYWSQRPMNELWAMFATENNPPLYFLLIKAWSAFTPFEVTWLRVPSALFSALTVWPLFLLTRTLVNTRAALVASLLFTFSNYHFGFAHEVRGYSLFTLLTTTSMCLLLGDVARRTLWLALVNTWLVYTHFFGWLAIGIQFLVVMSVPEQRARRKTFFRSLVVVLIAYVPYAIVFAQRLGQSVSEGTWLTAPVPEELYNMIWRWSNAPMLAVLFLALIVTACVKDRLRRSGLRFALIWAFVPLVGMFIVSFAVPMFLERYLVYAAPGFALAVASAVGVMLPEGKATDRLSMVPAVAMLFTFTPWKSNDLHPSRVVRQVEVWWDDGCSLQVEPDWYWITYEAANDLNALRRAEPVVRALNASPSATANETAIHTHVVVDAGSSFQDPERGWYKVLRESHSRVDSVEADRKVWVYRFRH